MPDVSRSRDGSALARRPRGPAVEPLTSPVWAAADDDRGEPEALPRASRGFIALYTLAYISTSLLFLAPLLVTLALKVNSLVGTEQAPNSLSLVAGVAALLAMFANPFFGRLSDRTSSRWGMRRPWIVVGLFGG